MRKLAVAVALLAAACSSGGSHDAASTTTSAPTTTTTTAPTTTTTTVDLSVPTTAADAARRLDAAESVIHDSSVADDDPRLAVAGHVEQIVIHVYVDHPDWASAVPDRWKPTVTDDTAAANALTGLVGPGNPNLPAWTIRRPKPIPELRKYYDEAQARWGVPWQYLASVNFIESKMGRIQGNSSAGAQGPMQFLPATWKSYGTGDIDDDHDSILGAAHYLAASGAPSRMHDALFAYNRAESYVTAITKYAQRMQADPLAYRGYWGWQVYFSTTLGAVWLREGWSSPTARPVTPADL
jgi:membrane-bound lytic murein transglycosylase B